MVVDQVSSIAQIHIYLFPTEDVHQIVHSMYNKQTAPSSFDMFSLHTVRPVWFQLHLNKVRVGRI